MTGKSKDSTYALRYRHASATADLAWAAVNNNEADANIGEFLHLMKKHHSAAKQVAGILHAFVNVPSVSLSSGGDRDAAEEALQHSDKMVETLDKFSKGKHTFSGNRHYKGDLRRACIMFIAAWKMAFDLRYYKIAGTGPVPGFTHKLAKWHVAVA